MRVKVREKMNSGREEVDSEGKGGRRRWRVRGKEDGGGGQ